MKQETVYVNQRLAILFYYKTASYFLDLCASKKVNVQSIMKLILKTFGIVIVGEKVAEQTCMLTSGVSDCL